MSSTIDNIVGITQDKIYMLKDKLDDIKYILKGLTYDIKPTRIIKHAEKLPLLSTWFTKDWWDYLLEDIEFYSYNNGLLFFQHMWCRATGHPCGVWFYNAGGLEPDMHCKYCNDDLG